MSGRVFCDTAAEGAADGLLALMTGISEEYWCAGWMDGLEFALWKAANEGPAAYGMGTITQRQCDLLRLLSEEAGGWWQWGELSEDFVTTSQWQEILAQHGEAGVRTVSQATANPEAGK